jgi:hypothetical protein
MRKIETAGIKAVMVGNRWIEIVGSSAAIETTGLTDEGDAAGLLGWTLTAGTVERTWGENGIDRICVPTSQIQAIRYDDSYRPVE